MRQIKTIVHPEMQITVFSWNQKYLLKFEQDTLEQTYKIPEIELSGIEEITTLLENEHFLQKVQNRFEQMQADLYQALEDLF